MTLTKAQMREAIRIMTSKAGSTKSKAKAGAARLNGMKGGRPKKGRAA